METETGCYDSAKSGIIIAGIGALIILLVATQNIILTVASIICVAIVLLSIVALMVTLGWQMGISESIGVVVMIGLSVDYCVLLSMSYNH